MADVSPGSILNGATSIASAGGTAANALTDIKALVASFTAANPDVEFAVFLMSPANAVGLAVATGLPGLGLDGGAFNIDVSRKATVQMDSTPTDPTVAATVLISLFQLNLVGLRVDRIINWKRARASAVRYISGATYV